MPSIGELIVKVLITAILILLATAEPAIAQNQSSNDPPPQRGVGRRE
ncbi:hypothetical protein NIES4101_74150 [Calothrix sp. NIES-4101]|nr:hypothetical protein NIES4101_74150 [Calothrix sp. NIES-4101]